MSQRAMRAVLLLVAAAAPALAAEPCGGWIRIEESWTGTVGELCAKQGKDCRAVEGRTCGRAVTSLEAGYGRFAVRSCEHRPKAGETVPFVNWDALHCGTAAIVRAAPPESKPPPSSPEAKACAARGGQWMSFPDVDGGLAAGCAVRARER